MFSPWLLGKLPHGCDREAEDRSPSPVGRGPGCTGIELSELRQDRSADFSPLPAVWAGPERGGLKSALLNSMAVHPDPRFMYQYYFSSAGRGNGRGTGEGQCHF